MQEYNQWLRISQEDLRVSRCLVGSSDAIIGPDLYYTQQSAEKSLKAYLVYKKQKINKTHNSYLSYMDISLANFGIEQAEKILEFVTLKI